MTDIGTQPIRSPWIVPVEKAPKMGTSILIIVLGFIVLIGELFYNFYSILGGKGFNFMLFWIMMLISMILIIVGAVRFARGYASRKYAMLMKYMEQKKQY